LTFENAQSYVMNAHAEGLQKRTVIQLQKLAFVEDVSDMPDDER